MSPLVSLTGVGVVLGKTQVLDGLDLTLPAGARIGVHGPNGVGKTTLLRLIATLVRPASGTISILGWDGTGVAPPFVRRRIGYVAHAPALNSELTLRENLELVANLSDSRLTAEEALSLVGLARVADKPAKLASQGMLRRADLARVLLTDSDLLLLDEPFTGLDEEAIGLVDALIERTIRRNGAALVVSHDHDRLAGFDGIVELSRHSAGGFA